MEVRDALGAAVLKYLEGSYNYVDWSIQVQTYLVAKDLWDTIEATAKPPKEEDDEAAFNAWNDKNSMALRVIKNSCQQNTFFEISEISFAKDAWNTLAKKYLPKVVLQVIDTDNYVEWSVQVKDHLMAHDLWDIVEETTNPLYQEDDYTTVHAWRNSMALHVIQNSCDLDTLFEIRDISSAKVAWNTLEKKYLPKNTNSDVIQVLEEYNYVDWSVQVKDYLTAHDLWDIVEENNKPPRQKVDEVACKAWSKKNGTALHVIQISCGIDAFSRIKKISTAKIAWNILAEWNRTNVDREAFLKVAQNWKHINIDHEAFKKDFKKVVESGVWNDVEDFLMRHPDSAGLKITKNGKTALHVAVDAGHESIVEKLVVKMSEQELAVKDEYGDTALFKTIYKKNYRMAECMLRKNVSLVSIKNSSDVLLVVKALYWSKKLARYLYSRTPKEDLNPEKGTDGARLCREAIYNQTLDIALDLIEHFPSLAHATDENDCSPLYALITRPFAFPSENRLVFWKRWI
ncbi:uncharacterized protein LOC132184022 [Corylus avellana]|uniref:uncharacterized protein LOC132184022 n=1 Tax=Corylus avellana TaxID=13451 RepID=UPI00286D083B|nr:uncharacterized protein LOC132184022 [Corylus avellana]